MGCFYANFPCFKEYTMRVLRRACATPIHLWLLLQNQRSELCKEQQKRCLWDTQIKLPITFPVTFWKGADWHLCLLLYMIHIIPFGIFFFCSLNLKFNSMEKLDY